MLLGGCHPLCRTRSGTVARQSQVAPHPAQLPPRHRKCPRRGPRWRQHQPRLAALCSWPRPLLPTLVGSHLRRRPSRLVNSPFLERYHFRRDVCLASLARVKHSCARSARLLDRKGWQCMLTGSFDAWLTSPVGDCHSSSDFQDVSTSAPAPFLLSYR